MAFAWLAETWQLFVEAVARCESGSGQPPIGLPQRVAGASGTSPALATRSFWEQMPKDTALREEDC
jgi:hypothetical protein